MSTARFISTTIALINMIENLCCRLVAQLVVGILFLMMGIVCYAIVTVGIMVLLVPFLLVFTLMVCPGSCVTLLIEKFSSAPLLDEDADFCRCREALEGIYMPGDNANRLWAPNRSSFNHMKKCIEQAYEKGKKGQNLKKVIAERLAQNISPSEDVKELLEPLESVRRYFPLLKDSFQKITASVLLMDDSVSEDRRSMREFKGDVRAALKEAEELMDFLDCPDNIGASVDVFNISNLEVFMLKNASDEQFKRLRFNFSESSSVADAVEKMLNEAKKNLEMCNLLGDVNPQAVNTDWSKAAEPYAMYKVCKLILDRHLTNSVQQMDYHLINMAADLIAMCVRESPKILVECSRKWAAEFREDNISAAIKLEGFACGVIDGARDQQHHQQLV
ncbi:hypothetical protein SUGI_0091330 [Cryptomeria japonica]|nr:hypothetical protein SUGI_0091330 [Cryptomeria japonica]